MGTGVEHHLLLYDYVENVVELRAPYRQAHLERIATAREAEQILMAGALGDPTTGAAFVFRGIRSEEIEEFVRGDPYVQAGLVTAWRIEPWTLV